MYPPCGQGAASCPHIGPPEASVGPGLEDAWEGGGGALFHEANMPRCLSRNTGVGGGCSLLGPRGGAWERGPRPLACKEQGGKGGASPSPWPPRAPGTWETGQGGIGPGTPRPPRPPHADPASPGSKATLRHDRGRFLRLRVATRVPSLWSHRPGEACPGRRRPGDPTLPAPALRGPRATEKPATVFILK